MLDSLGRRRHMMKNTIQCIAIMIEDEEGATAIEYGLLAALIAGAIISTVVGLSPKIVGLYNTVDTALP